MELELGDYQEGDQVSDVETAECGFIRWIAEDGRLVVDFPSGHKDLESMLKENRLSKVASLGPVFSIQPARPFGGKFMTFDIQPVYDVQQGGVTVYNVTTEQGNHFKLPNPTGKELSAAELDELLYSFLSTQQQVAKGRTPVTAAAAGESSMGISEGSPFNAFEEENARKPVRRRVPMVRDQDGGYNGDISVEDARIDILMPEDGNPALAEGPGRLEDTSINFGIPDSRTVPYNRQRRGEPNAAQSERTSATQYPAGPVKQAPKRVSTSPSTSSESLIKEEVMEPVSDKTAFVNMADTALDQGPAGEQPSSVSQDYTILGDVKPGGVVDVVKIKDGTHYKVEIDAKGNINCSCPAYKYNNRKCKHCEMVKEQLAAAAPPEAPVAAPKKKLMKDLTQEEKEAMRIPAEEAMKIWEEVRPIIEANTERWTFTGSYARGRNRVKDLDIVAVGDPVALLAAAKEKDYDVVMSGAAIVRFNVNGFMMDITMTRPDEWGAALLYRIGPKELNMQMRADAKRKGWKLNEHGLFDEKGTKLAGENEEEIFEAMGMKYLVPPDREKFSERYRLKMGSFVDGNQPLGLDFWED